MGFKFTTCCVLRNSYICRLKLGITEYANELYPQRQRLLLPLDSAYTRTAVLCDDMNGACGMIFQCRIPGIGI